MVQVSFHIRAQIFKLRKYYIYNDVDYLIKLLINLKVSVEVTYYVIIFCAVSNCKIAASRHKLVSVKVSQKWQATQSFTSKNPGQIKINFQIYKNEYSFPKIGFMVYLQSKKDTGKKCSRWTCLLSTFDIPPKIYITKETGTQLRSLSILQPLKRFSKSIRLSTTHLAKDAFALQ